MVIQTTILNNIEDFIKNHIVYYPQAKAFQNNYDFLAFIKRNIVQYIGYKVFNAKNTEWTFSIDADLNSLINEDYPEGHWNLDINLNISVKDLESEDKKEKTSILVNLKRSRFHNYWKMAELK